MTQRTSQQVWCLLLQLQQHVCSASGGCEREGRRRCSCCGPRCASPLLCCCCCCCCCLQIAHAMPAMSFAALQTADGRCGRCARWRGSAWRCAALGPTMPPLCVGTGTASIMCSWSSGEEHGGCTLQGLARRAWSSGGCAGSAPLPLLWLGAARLLTLNPRPPRLRCAASGWSGRACRTGCPRSGSCGAAAPTPSLLASTATAAWQVRCLPA